MYISNNFIYTELHKTAGTHIGKWLSILAPGTQVGKHNRVPHSLRDRPIIGSIRNPWDWYVSLWGYGCDMKGSVWYQTANRYNFSYYRKQLPKEMGRKLLSPSVLLKQSLSDRSKPLAEWSNSYADSSNPECFKSWLKLMFDYQRRLDIREGFGFSPISRKCGLLSYRFFKFFTDLDQKLYNDNLFSNNLNIEEIWNQHKIAYNFIRMENLEDDLLQIMKTVGVDVSINNKEKLLDAKISKTNTSSRLPASYYLDDETIEMIYDRENLIVKLFNYTPPI